MTAYAIRRLLLLVPTLFVVTLVVFLTVRFIPGDVIDMMSAQMGSSGGGEEINREYLEHAMGLDVPIPLQYVRWLGVVPQADASTLACYRVIWANPSGRMRK
jgi:peptide/nickel transport system permease protein